MIPNNKPSVEIALSPQDVSAFEEELRRLFPTVRFVLCFTSQQVTPPTVEFLDSLNDRGKWITVEAWIDLPEGWQPEWGPQIPGSDVLVCLNRPRFWIAVSSMWPPTTTPLWRPLADDGSLEGEVTYEWMHAGVIYSTWYGEDPERMAFVRRMFRLAKKRASNKIFSVDPMVGKARHLYTSGVRTWIGHDVATWIKGAPNRFIDGFIRPAEGYESYDWPLPTRAEVTKVRPRNRPEPIEREGEDESFLARFVTDLSRGRPR